MNVFIDNNPAVAFFISIGAGILALLFCGYLLTAFRGLRRSQKVILGEGRDRDLIAHATATSQQVEGLAEEMRSLNGLLEREGRRLDNCLTFRSVVRYDAYRDLSGMQSTSMCLLDTHFSGIIVSSIQSRDHARIYVKEVQHGESKEKLSPEEIQVLKEAMGLKTQRPHKVAEGGTIA